MKSKTINHSHLHFTNLSLFLLVLVLMGSCRSQNDALPIEGTWELIAATTQEKDTVFSTFDPSRSMIKILNRSHFAFLNHAVGAQQDSTAAPFSAGGGTYSLTDSLYTEHLTYFSDPAWENHTFQFTVQLKNDTLVQTGVEKVEELGIDRIITETYRRVPAPQPPGAD